MKNSIESILNYLSQIPYAGVISIGIASAIVLWVLIRKLCKNDKDDNDNEGNQDKNNDSSPPTPPNTEPPLTNIAL